MTVTLDDKYIHRTGRIYLTGVQALVRLPLQQKWADEAAGLNTAGFISGYRGSPLGGLDMLLWQAGRYLTQNNIVFKPGLNEDLGATAVWGSQQTQLTGSPRHQGVFGLWYGKGPGVDRSGDVLKHANYAGTEAMGGVLAIAGDDHTSKSSTLPHQTDFAFMDAGIPVLYPSNVQDVLDLGLYGWALSRYSGCWVAMKAIADTMDASASVELSTPTILRPQDFEMPVGGLNIRWPDTPLDQEERLFHHKLPAVEAFVRANKLNKVYQRGAPVYGLVTSGKSYVDTVQALDILGLPLEKAMEKGIALLKVAMPWPLEKEGIRHFVRGLKEVLVVEEKRSFMESQLRDVLYHMPADQRPHVLGKTDQTGSLLLSPIRDLNADMIARTLYERLRQVMPGLELRAPVEHKAISAASKKRIPFYCSGCPHNTSTRVPEGSQALAGIGCHYMATWIYTGTKTFSQMGGEGVAWIGQAPFTHVPHVFSNLGDGTYFHSGILAIRAAVAAKVNMTYKILYNDAVAMTGGQPVDGTISVPQITRQLAAEGVQKIVVVSDAPDKYPIGSDFASGVGFYHRDQMDYVQRTLRDTPGVTAIVYDQTCAAEKRRRRKRGLMEDPPKRAFIYDAVCEGCGDCSKQSNCLSVVPKETEFGTKRMIDQSSCNKDYSCIKGFCPSFITFHEGAKDRLHIPHLPQEARHIPDPDMPRLDKPYSIYVAGVGGTGIVTVGALIAMAAHMEGKGCSTLDMTGLAQKGGAVHSHIKIAAHPQDIHAVRIGRADADLLLGPDMLVSVSDEVVGALGDKTRALINTQKLPTGEFVQDSTVYNFPEEEAYKILTDMLEDRVLFEPLSDMAHAFTGDTMGVNIFMLGYAYQKGWLPVSAKAMLEAIRLNGVAVQKNETAFMWGRLAAHHPDKIRPHLKKEEATPRLETLGQVIHHRMKHLEEYQDKALALKYKALVDKVQAHDKHEGQGLTSAVAWNYAKLLSYKDEYEVARLYSRPEFKRQLKEAFGDYKSIQFNLAPPLFSKKDAATGLPVKSTYGAWMLGAFGLLAKMKGLRGTWMDPFGYTHERCTERQLIKDYEERVAFVLDHLKPENYGASVEYLAIADSIRGFGHVKEKNIAEYFKKSVSIKQKIKG